MNDDRLVVVGAGHAGVELAFAARKAGWLGAITLLGDEADFPYHRPPLSKAYLHGEADRESLNLRAAATYENANITLDLGVHVNGIDAAAQTVSLADGRTLPYAKLAICTGGRPRPLLGATTRATSSAFSSASRC